MTEDLKLAAERIVEIIQHYAPSAGEDADELVPVRLGEIRDLKAALAQHDQATPGVEPVGVSRGVIDRLRSFADRCVAYDQEYTSTSPFYRYSPTTAANDLRDVLGALPTPIRGGIPEEGLGSDRCNGTLSDAQSVRPDGGEG